MNMELRHWTMDDLDSLVRYANDPEISKNLRDAFPYPYSREDGIIFIESITKKEVPNILAISLEGEAIGGIGIHPKIDIHCRNAELGYWLGQPYWGKGIMTKAVPQMVNYAFEHWDIDRIYACPFGPNIASQKVLEKAGFELEACLEGTIYKNGDLLDEIFYGIRRKNIKP